MRQPRKLIFFLFALVSSVIVLDLALFDRALSSWISFLLLVLTIEVGHILLTHFIIMSNDDLRKSFPWVGFAVFSLSVFAVLYCWEDLAPTKWFRGAYWALVVFHSTQQALGVALLFLTAQGAKPHPDAFPRFKKFVERCRWLLIAQLLVGIALPAPTLSSRIALACGFSALIFVLWAGVYWRIRKASGSDGDAWVPLVLLARFVFYPLGSVSLIGLAIMQIVHGLEYYYIYHRIYRHPASRRSILWFGFLAAVAFQAYYFAVKFPGSPRLASQSMGVLAITLVVVHAFQDWYLFNGNKEMAFRIRHLLAVKS